MENAKQKVIAIAAGETHTVALAGDGSVYSWGRGTFGRLGTGSEGDEAVPIRVKFGLEDDDKEVKIVGISAGAYHTHALADDGSVWSWGYNLYGQLGFNGDNSLVPLLLEGFLEQGSPGPLIEGSKSKGKFPLKVSSIKAGGMTSMAIDNLGVLWMWGNCPQQNRSNEWELLFVSSSTPIPVWHFHGHTVVKVACGNDHVIALVSAGETHQGDDLICYSWGNNNQGQLGLGDKEPRNKPEAIETFMLESSWAVYEVACGAQHSALLAHKKRPTEKLQSVCWTFGNGDNGQLGHGTVKNALSPEPVEGLPENIFLVSIDCGLFHTSVVSSAGDVWSWGMEKGLGLCPDSSFTGTDSGDAITPLLISSKFSEPVQIVCGAAHTVLVSDGGYKLWSWGRGRSGVLGNGKTVDCFAPSIVMWPPLAELLDTKDDGKTSVKKDPEEITEMEKKLSVAMEEMNILRSKYEIMERYASILHGSIFGKRFEEQDIPISLQNSGSFDIGIEWENVLESSDRSKLTRLETFYRDMLGGVKDQLMKKKIKEIIQECLSSSATRN